MTHLQAEPDIRKPFRELLEQMLGGANVDDVVDSVAQFRSSKRGRKPSFSRVEGVGTIHQITYLGGIDIQKAG